MVFPTTPLCFVTLFVFQVCSFPLSIGVGHVRQFLLTVCQASMLLAATPEKDRSTAAVGVSTIVAFSVGLGLPPSSVTSPTSLCMCALYAVTLYVITATGDTWSVAHSQMKWCLSAYLLPLRRPSHFPFYL